MGTYTHGHCLPLIGGAAVGTTRVLGNRPKWIASWQSVFDANDQYARQYFDDVAYFNLDENEYPSQKVDIVTAVPPCAGLSSANTTKGENANNPRGCNAPSNLHMLHASKFAMESIQPRVMIVENAPALFTRAGEPFAERINDLAIEHGYSMSMVKTSTIKHGLPQIRPRSFFFLWRGNKVPILNPISKPYKPVHEILSTKFKITDLVRTDKHGMPSDDYLWKFIQLKNQKLNKQQILQKYAGEKMVSVYRVIADNGWLPEFISWAENLMRNAETDEEYKQIEKAYKVGIKGKKKLDAGSDIIDGTTRMVWESTFSLMWKTLPNIMHPFEDRWLMISEALALMGFPEDFAEKVDIPTRMSNVVCQNVPAHTAADWVEEAVSALEGNREWVDRPTDDDGKPRILRQSNIHGRTIMEPRWKL